MVAPLSDLRHRMAQAWAPRERLSLADWCTRELRLSADTGPNPGRYDLDRFPFWREVLDAAEDPETEEIIMVAATQVGKTTALQAILAGLACLRPAPAMLCAPDQPAIRKLRNKFYSLCETTPVLRGRIPPRYKRNMEEIDFGNCLCHLAFTGNPQRVAAESCRVVLVTETDRSRKATHEGALHKLISERVKAWHNFLKVFEGTPTDDSSTIVQLYEASDQRKWLVPCLHCGTYQELRFFVHKEGPHAGCGGIGGLKKDDNTWCTADEALEGAYYICLKGCRIESRDKANMVSRGVWCPAGCEVDADGKVTGTPKRTGRRKGFHLSSLVADTITFGRIAAEYLESRDDSAAMQSFFNNWLGLRYVLQTKVPKASVLHRRLRGGHPRGTAPPGAIFLTSGSDVHASDVWWVVRAWGEGATSWLVDWGIYHKKSEDGGLVRPDSHLVQLDPLLLKEWPLVTENMLGHKSLLIAKMGIDCQYDTAEVQKFVTKHPGGRVLAVAGDDAVPPGVPYKFSLVERNTRTGKPYPGGLKRWAINTDLFKTDVQDRWNAPPNELGAWFLTNAPYEETEDYLRQLANEAPVQERSKSGHLRKVWKVISTGLGNHPFDAEVYARAVAEMVVEGRWDNLAARFRAPPASQQTKRSKGFVPQTKGSFVRR